MSELFDRFEINRAPRWPLVSRLLALSVVLHGVFLVAVVYVPQLSNMLRVAGEFAGLKFVSQDYDPTLVGQRATIIQFAPHEKLYYPPDYFGASEVAETSPYNPTFVEQAAPPPRQPKTPRASPHVRRARAPFVNCSKASARPNLRRSNPTPFNSKRSPRSKRKTCSSPRRRAAARPGSRARRFDASSRRASAPGTRAL